MSFFNRSRADPVLRRDKVENDRVVAGVAWPFSWWRPRQDRFTRPTHEVNKDGAFHQMPLQALLTQTYDLISIASSTM